MKNVSGFKFLLFLPLPIFWGWIHTKKKQSKKTTKKLHRSKASVTLIFAAKFQNRNETRRRKRRRRRRKTNTDILSLPFQHFSEHSGNERKWRTKGRINEPLRLCLNSQSNPIHIWIYVIYFTQHSGEHETKQRDAGFQITKNIQHDTMALKTLAKKNYTTTRNVKFGTESIWQSSS